MNVIPILPIGDLQTSIDIFACSVRTEVYMHEELAVVLVLIRNHCAIAVGTKADLGVSNHST